MFFYDSKVREGQRELCAHQSVVIDSLKAQLAAKERTYITLDAELRTAQRELADWRTGKRRFVAFGSTLATPAPTATTEALVLDLRKRVEALEAAAKPSADPSLASYVRKAADYARQTKRLYVVKEHQGRYRVTSARHHAIHPGDIVAEVSPCGSVVLCGGPA